MWDRPQILVLAGAFFFTGMAAFVKAAMETVPLYEMVFFRSVISAVLLGTLLRRQGISFRATNLPLLLMRALAGFAAMSCNFYALAHLTLGDAAMLVNTFPLFVALLSFLFLGERPTRGLLGWIALAMTGVALILQPQLNILNYAGFIALMAGLFSGLVVVVIHQSHETDPSLRIAFYFVATCTIGSLPLMMQDFVVPGTKDLIFLLAAGLLGTAGQIVMTRAYGFEEVSKTSPIAYVGVVLSFIIGVIFWKEIPTWLSIAGSAVVIAACIRIARIEKVPPPRPS